jgi:hypothetical protein
VQDYAKGQKRDIVKMPDYQWAGCGFYDGGNGNTILKQAYCLFFSS